MQVERVFGQRLAGFDAFAVRVHHARTHAAVQGDGQFAFAHHAVCGDQFHDVADFRERHRLVVDDAEAPRGRGCVLDRGQRVYDHQSFGHDGHQLAFRGLHGNAGAEQGRVLRSSEQARIIGVDAVLHILEASSAAKQERHDEHDHGHDHQCRNHRRRCQHLLQRHAFTFR